MRIVIQRVLEAKVEVGEEVVGEIERGMLVFLGIHKDDTADDTLWLVKKLAGLRIFEDEHGKMNLGVHGVGGKVLVVSQFTLYGNCRNGRRPDFISTMQGCLAERIYDKFVEEVRAEVGNVETGRFGALMKVSLVNDGPVTFIIDTTQN